MDEKEVIRENIIEIKQILGIIKSEVAEIDEKGNSKNQTKRDSVDEDVRVSILFTQRSYLDFFRKIIEFLYSKLEEKAQDKDFFFYIPQIRALIEIYSYLLYFCFQNEKRQMELIMSKTLFTLAKVDASYVTKEIQEQYVLQYKLYKSYMDRENLIFPETSSGFSKKWLDKSGYDNPSVEQMLQTEWIKEASPLMRSVSKKNIDKNSFYNIYRHFSNYVHGNVMHKEDYGNEKFWIMSETINLSIAIAELVNVKILDNSKRKVLSEWIKRVSENSSGFMRVWNQRRERINTERMIK